MGFYDMRCLVTGISLTASDATLVPLTRHGRTYRPICCGIPGHYDRYGSIDGVDADLNTELVLAYFRDRRRDGRFVIDTDFLGVDPDAAITDIEDLLWYFERNNLSFDDDIGPVAALDGSMVTFALIAQVVWDALTAFGGSVFGESVVADEIYRQRLPELAEQVRQLDAMNAFLPRHGLVWAPPAEKAQRYPTDVGMQYDLTEFLDQARADYRGVATVEAALDTYEQIMDTKRA